MRTLVVIFLILAGFSVQAPAQNKLRIELSALSEKGGDVYIAVFDSAENFMKKKTAAAILRLNGEVRSDAVAEIELPDGDYALTVFQDENANGQLDRGQMGIPEEKYGFSNDVKPVFGPPSFEACRFGVKGDSVVAIRMQ